jgi:hypothetical protein
LPEEVFEVDKFISLSERAECCIVKRLSKTVKLKIRTPGKLFTMKIDPESVEGVIKKLRCEIVEI